MAGCRRGAAVGCGAMDLRLDGKVALVTGGSRGIGRAIATRFAEAGAEVMLSSRKAEALAEAAASMAGLDGDVAWHAANAGDPERGRRRASTATVERFGSLDILVNNAATNPYYGPLMDIDLARAEKTVQVNLEAALVWTQCAWRASMASGGGSVINLSSIGGLSVEPGIGWYNVTKAALVHLTRQLAGELGPGVRVNALAPGLVQHRLRPGPVGAGRRRRGHAASRCSGWASPTTSPRRRCSWPRTRRRGSPATCSWSTGAPWPCRRGACERRGEARTVSPKSAAPSRSADLEFRGLVHQVTDPTLPERLDAEPLHRLHRLRPHRRQPARRAPAPGAHAAAPAAGRAPAHRPGRRGHRG